MTVKQLKDLYRDSDSVCMMGIFDEQGKQLNQGCADDFADTRFDGREVLRYWVSCNVCLMVTLKD